MVYGMRQRNHRFYLDYGSYQSIECAPQQLEYLLTISTNVAAGIVPEAGGDGEPVATEESSFDISTNRFVPENLRRSEADAGVGACIRQIHFDRSAILALGATISYRERCIRKYPIPKHARNGISPW